MSLFILVLSTIGRDLCIIAVENCSIVLLLLTSLSYSSISSYAIRNHAQWNWFDDEGSCQINYDVGPMKF